MDQHHIWHIAKPARSSRPDLSRKALILLTLAALACVTLAVVLGRDTRPGEPIGQTSAVLGSVILLLPLAFFIAKRCGVAASPPTWFVLHALSGFVGIGLIAVHVASVSGIAPPMVPLIALVFLVVQGFWMRAFLTKRLSFLFARAPRSFDYGAALETQKAAIAEIIARKQALLARLDPAAREATFSPRLRHWLRAPLKALRYEWLAHREARLVGAKARAGAVLSYSRRLHLAIALVFYAGLLAHVIVMLFFAGYAAKGGEIYWWHIADWGR